MTVVKSLVDDRFQSQVKIRINMNTNDRVIPIAINISEMVLDRLVCLFSGSLFLKQFNNPALSKSSFAKL